MAEGIGPNDSGRRESAHRQGHAGGADGRGAAREAETRVVGRVRGQRGAEVREGDRGDSGDCAGKGLD